MTPLRAAMHLLNCKRCDDVVKLVDKLRRCECGQASGQLLNGTPMLTGAARLLEIPWPDYDNASAGEWQQWRLLKR